MFLALSTTVACLALLAGSAQAGTLPASIPTRATAGSNVTSAPPHSTPGAQGDAGMVSPGEPIQLSSPMADGATAMTVGEHGGGGQWTCGNSWDTISNYAEGVAIGQCAGNSTLNRTQYSDRFYSYGNVTTYGQGGYLSGDFDACGWVDYKQVTWIPGSPSYTGCSSPDTGVWSGRLRLQLRRRLYRRHVREGLLADLLRICKREALAWHATARRHSAYGEVSGPGAVLALHRGPERDAHHGPVRQLLGHGE